MIFGGVPKSVLAIKVLRAIARHPADVGVLVAHAHRMVRRVGGGGRVLREALGGRIRFTSFVVHDFMDAAQVAPAWELMERGIRSDDPKLRETQERLSSCMYTMSHPEDGRLVPACVQHSVLDPAENRQLRRLLPLSDQPAPSRSAVGTSRPSGLTPVIRTHPHPTPER